MYLDAELFAIFKASLRHTTAPVEGAEAGLARAGPLASLSAERTISSIPAGGKAKGPPCARPAAAAIGPWRFRVGIR